MRNCASKSFVLRVRHLAMNSSPCSGAVGNMLDRIRWGQVTDFIDLGWFPVFNVADSAITVGAVCLFSYFFFVHRPEEAAAPAPEGAAETPH